MSGSFVVSMLVGVTLTTALALTASRLARRSRAAFRHVLLAASFAVLAALPIAPLAVPSIPVAIPIAAPSEAMAPAIDFVSDVMTPAPGGDGSLWPVAPAPHAFTMPSASVLLLAVWIVGAVCFLTPVAVGLWQVRTIRRSALPWRRGQAIAARAAEELGVRQRVDVHMHEGVAGPMTCGIARPTVLFPIDAADWPDQEIDRAIVHELEHVRRRDWLSQCLARVVCAVYWFHPLVWIARQAFELEAERACDDAVLIRAEATGYADQLVGLAARLSSTHRRPLLAMASRRDLAARVRALLDVRQARGRAGTTAISAACIVAIALVLAMSSLRIVTRAQAAAAKFDAASVRPHAGDAVGKRDFLASYGPQNIDFRGLSIGFLIGEAYGVPVGHVIGASDQVTSALRDLQGYDIEARAPRPASRDELRGMLQALLADRFKVALHRETREREVFRLVAASGGPKITAVQSGDYQSTASSDGFAFHNAEISRLAGLLTSFVGREVVDETGLKGLYDFTLRMPDGYTPASAKSGIATGNAPDAASFAGPLRALGLELVSGKASIDYVVIDHVERPSSNDAAATQQPAPAQRFEAVSIRPCQDDTPPPGANGGQRSSQGGFPTISTGRFTIECGTIERLISNAYVLNGERLENNQARIGDVSWWKGGPEWIRYDKFTIEASAPGVSDRAILLGPMLRTLLEDRFKLKLHRETQDAPMYAMTIAKGGLKIQPMAPGGCAEDRDQGFDAASFRANAAAVDAGTAKPNCGGMLMLGSPGHSRWTIGGTTLPNFAGTLTAQMDHFVVDKTGVSSDTQFNIHLEFAADEHVPGADKRNPRTEFAPADAPTIFKALEDQLGLKLEATKGPQGVLVIDHVERPTPDGGWTTWTQPQRAVGPGTRPR